MDFHAVFAKKFFKGIIQRILIFKHFGMSNALANA
jgi:hypothetical protein